MNLHLDRDINENFPLEQFLFTNIDRLSFRLYAELRGEESDLWEGEIEDTTADSVNDFKVETEINIGNYQGLNVSVFITQEVRCYTNEKLENKLFDFAYSVDYIQIGCNEFEIPSFMSDFIINETKKLN